MSFTYLFPNTENNCRILSHGAIYSNLHAYRLYNDLNTEQGDFMQILAILIRLLASLCRLPPLKQRVAFLSRQSNKLSLDYKLLIDELEKTLDNDKIAICITNPETKTSVIHFARNTVKQLYYACTSKVVILDGYLPTVCIPKKDKRITVIQLWHALGAIKKFGYQCIDTPAGRSSKSARIAHMHENYDYLIAGGPGTIDTYAEAFRYPKEQILPLGLPRIDYLLDPNPQAPRRKKAELIKHQYDFFSDDKPTILYAPTLRKGSGYENWLTDSLYSLTEKLTSQFGNKYDLIIAGHPLNLGFDKALLNQYPQLHFIPGVATIDLLELADEVISDYSAIIFEAGLLGKPLSYHVPDYDQYAQSPGLNVDPRTLSSTTVQAYLGSPTYGATTKLAQFILKQLDA